MQRITEETKRKIVKLHIQDGRTLASLAAEYGICHATVTNWIRAYREECQTNDAVICSVSAAINALVTKRGMPTKFFQTCWRETLWQTKQIRSGVQILPMFFYERFHALQLYHN